MSGVFCISRLRIVGIWEMKMSQVSELRAVGNMGNEHESYESTNND